jgi:hypothetical protein
MAKQCVWILWIGSAAAIVLGSGGVATAGRWVFGLTLVAHLVEFVLKRSVLERAGGSMGRHFVQTMIYGLFHWRPIEKQLESEAPS